MSLGGQLWRGEGTRKQPPSCWPIKSGNLWKYPYVNIMNSRCYYQRNYLKPYIWTWIWAALRIVLKCHSSKPKWMNYKNIMEQEKNGLLMKYYCMEDLNCSPGQLRLNQVRCAASAIFLPLTPHWRLPLFLSAFRRVILISLSQR